MVPAGIGYEVLKFAPAELRDIADLPEDVRILQALSPILEKYQTAGASWVYGSGPKSIYILIAHRYCLRMSPGVPYTHDTLEHFLKRYWELDHIERQPLTPIVENSSMTREVWHRDEDGKVREYIWRKGQWERREDY